MIFKIVHNKEIHILNKKASYPELLAFVKTAFKKLPAHWALSYLDAEGDKIAIENHADLEILYENNTARSLKLTIEAVEEHELLLKSESDQDDAPEIIEENKKESVAEVQSETSRLNTSILSQVSQPELEQLVRSKIQEMFPEITKKVSQELSEMTRNSGIRQEEPQVKIETETKTKSVEVNSPSSDVIHHGVTCDGCGVVPIVGVRYKSLIQHNFDFCERCEATRPHPHAFIKIKHPDQSPRVLIASMEDNERPGIDLNGSFLSADNLKNFFGGLFPNADSARRPFSCGMRRNREYQAESKPEPEVKKPEPPVQVAPKKVEEPEIKKEEPKKEEPKKEAPTKEEFFSAEERNVVMATYLEGIFEERLDRLMKFVARFPLLNREALAEKWVELHFK